MAVSRPSSRWTTEFSTKKTMIPPITTAPTLSQFIRRPPFSLVTFDNNQKSEVTGPTTGRPARPHRWEGSEHAGTRYRHWRHRHQGGPGRRSHWHAPGRTQEDRDAESVNAGPRGRGGAGTDAGVGVGGHFRRHLSGSRDRGHGAD